VSRRSDKESNRRRGDQPAASREDASRLGGRLARYAQVGTTVGGLAARLATSRYLGVGLDQDRHARDLGAALGGLKGPLMKAAQLLATIPNAVPDSYAVQFAELQSNAPPMGWPFVRRRMAAELGGGWENRFAEFSHEAAHAASLGQVHKAEHSDGRALACKLQYPDMRSAVEADLDQLRIALSLYQRTDGAVNMSYIQQELAARLREELDYELEAAHVRLYRLMLKGVPGVHLPEVVDALSTRRLLTMTWLEGGRLLDVVDLDQERRDAIAHNLFHCWYVPLYRFGVLHGDPHLGNYTVRSDDAINLLDFGCIRIFEAKFIGGVIALYEAVRDGDEAKAVHAYETWGFTGLSRQTIATLNRWAQFIYGPLLDDRLRTINEGNENERGVYGARVANQVHRELRQQGGVTPPREFVFMDRAAIGLGSVFMRLGARLNWHALFESLIDGFTEAAMARRQMRAMKSAGVSPPL
jgi:predicted unusual protein kinase regulating ubiquinone biosynthesis (AarF/ABC1/UbiB family)